jgi:hypothetical protein
MQRRALLIIDEAQNLSLDALEELRMLSNIVNGTAMALQSFLLGQPQFRSVMGNPALEQLRQRVAAAYHLRPLTSIDTKAYIEHRLRCAGWKGDPAFDDECFGAIYHHTAGIPRRVNALCSRLLLFGMLEDTHAISASMVNEVASDFTAEMSSIASPNGSATSVDNGKTAPLLGMIIERLDELETVTARHGRTIRRMLEIMGRYVQ